jgi:hypothetical protein
MRCCGEGAAGGCEEVGSRGAALPSEGADRVPAARAHACSSGERLRLRLQGRAVAWCPAARCAGQLHAMLGRRGGAAPASAGYFGQPRQRSGETALRPLAAAAAVPRAPAPAPRPAEVPHQISVLGAVDRPQRTAAVVLSAQPRNSGQRGEARRGRCTLARAGVSLPASEQAAFLRVPVPPPPLRAPPGTGAAPARAVAGRAKQAAAAAPASVQQPCGRRRSRRRTARRQASSRSRGEQRGQTGGPAKRPSSRRAARAHASSTSSSSTRQPARRRVPGSSAGLREPGQRSAGGGRAEAPSIKSEGAQRRSSSAGSEPSRRPRPPTPRRAAGVALVLPPARPSGLTTSTASCRIHPDAPRRPLISAVRRRVHLPLRSRPRCSVPSRLPVHPSARHCLCLFFAYSLSASILSSSPDPSHITLCATTHKVARAHAALCHRLVCPLDRAAPRAGQPHRRARLFRLCRQPTVSAVPTRIRRCRCRCRTARARSDRLCTKRQEKGRSAALPHVDVRPARMSRGQHASTMACRRRPTSLGSWLGRALANASGDAACSRALCRSGPCS